MSATALERNALPTKETEEERDFRLRATAVIDDFSETVQATIPNLTKLTLKDKDNVDWKLELTEEGTLKLESSGLKINGEPRSVIGYLSKTINHIGLLGTSGYTPIEWLGFFEQKIPELLKPTKDAFDARISRPYRDMPGHGISPAATPESLARAQELVTREFPGHGSAPLLVPGIKPSGR